MFLVLVACAFLKPSNTVGGRQWFSDGQKKIKNKVAKEFAAIDRLFRNFATVLLGQQSWKPAHSIPAKQTSRLCLFVGKDANLVINALLNRNEIFTEFRILQVWK